MLYKILHWCGKPSKVFLLSDQSLQVLYLYIYLIYTTYTPSFPLSFKPIHQLTWPIYKKKYKKILTYLSYRFIFSKILLYSLILYWLRTRSDLVYLVSIIWKYSILEFTKRVWEMSFSADCYTIFTIPLHTHNWDNISRTFFVKTITTKPVDLVVMRESIELFIIILCI